MTQGKQGVYSTWSLAPPPSVGVGGICMKSFEDLTPGGQQDKASKDSLMLCGGHKIITLLLYALYHSFFVIGLQWF